MSIKIKFFLLPLILISLISCSDDSVVVVDQNSLDYINDDSFKSEVISLINEYREQKGMQPLTENNLASELALKHSVYMIEHNSINHDNFVDRQQKLQNNAKATSVSENVAKGHANPKGVVNGWLKSKNHLKNIESDFSHTGLAAVKDSKGQYYYTQIFYK